MGTAKYLMCNIPRLIKLKIYDISENVCRHFDFAAVRENTYKNGTVITQPLTRKNRRWRGRSLY
jgi:hypothetical protein